MNPSNRVRGPSVLSDEVARNRRTESAALARRLRGELDWITMRALAKDPEDRYGSTSELAADVKRYLDGESVLAGPPSGFYRARKFIRRHRTGVGAGIVGVAMVLAFAVVMSVQAVTIARERDRAKSQADIARQTADLLSELIEAADPDWAQHPDASAREVLDLAEARVVASPIEDTELQAGLLRTLGETYSKLGELDRALPLLQQSAEIYETLLGVGHVESVTSINRWASAALMAGQLDRAEALRRRARIAGEATLGKDHREVLTAQDGLAQVLEHTGRREEAHELRREVLEARRRTLGDDHRQTLRSLTRMAMMYDGCVRRAAGRI